MAVVVVILSATDVSWALEIDSARIAVELGEEGLEAFHAGKYERALFLFQEAERRVHSPVFQLFGAKALEEQGRWVEAVGAYWELVMLNAAPNWPRQWHDAKADAEGRLRLLSANLPRMLISASKNGPETITWDGRAVPANFWFNTDPGQHVLRVFQGERQRFESVVTVAAASLAVVDVPPPSLRATLSLRRIVVGSLEPRFNQPQSLPSSPSYLAPIVAAGFGLIGVGLGVVAGIAAVNEHQTLAEICDGASCPAEAREHQESGRRWAELSTVGFAVGGVGLATSGILFWVTPRGTMGSPGMSGVSWGVAGSF